MEKIYLPLFILVLLSISLSCKRTLQDNRRLSWSADLYKLGTNSSPRLIDLNQDQILDIVMGTGRNEFQENDTAIIAFNGENGKILWTQTGTDQVVGSAVFYDITNDQIPDVFIGGRNHQLYALDGKDGSQIWKYTVQSEAFNTLGYARFNFYNPYLIPDQTGDNIKDLIVSNGGNVKAAIHSDKSRYPGVLMILDSTTGEIISADTIPDGKETYMSPLVYDFENKGNLSILFGSGGETASGSFYKTSLDDLLKGDISNAKILARDTGHGFFAPPVLADITEDGIKDIIVNSHGGKMFAIDGKSDAIIWQKKFPNAEASNTVAPGYFNADNIPDFVSCYALGQWPENTGMIQVLIDGKDGTVLSIDSLGTSGFYSPITCDLDGDQFDEVILPINTYDHERTRFTKIEHELKVFDHKRDTIWNLVPKDIAKNQSTTPWIGDIDQNGKLDIIYGLLANTPRLYEFYGMQVRRKAIRHKVPEQISWGAYMGNNYDGVFRNQR